MYDVRVYPVYPVVMGMQAIHSIGYAFPKPAGAALCPMPVAVGGFAASLPGRAATSKASGDHPNWTQRDEDEAHSMLYKTELCRSYQETGACNYGPKCQVKLPGARLAPRRPIAPPRFIYKCPCRRRVVLGTAFGESYYGDGDRAVCGRTGVRVYLGAAHLALVVHAALLPTVRLA
jgi:hypothetical protein